MNDYRMIAGASLVAAPVLMLVGDALRVGAGMDYAWLVLLKLAFVAFLPAALALAWIQSRQAGRTGLVGAGLTMAGAMAGVGIITTHMMSMAIEATGDPAVIQTVEQAFLAAGVREYVFFYPVSGLFFPIGLLVLSVGLVRAKAAPPAAVALLALGAVLFPVGRIGQIDMAVIASGVALSIAMTTIAVRVLSESAARSERTETLLQNV